MPTPRKVAKASSESASDNLAMEKAMESIQNEIAEAQADIGSVEAKPIDLPLPVDLAVPIRNPSHIIQVDCRPIPDPELKELVREIKNVVANAGELAIITGNQPVVILHAYSLSDALKALRSIKLLGKYAIEIIISELGKVGIPTTKEAFSK